MEIEMEETPGEYVPQRQLPERLGKRLGQKPVTVQTLWNWERDGKGPPVTRIGRNVFYYWPSVEKWMRDLEQQPRNRRLDAAE
jgi:hypothetical protein